MNQPVDWFSLAILFQVKAIHHSIQQTEGNKHNNYSVLQSLLLLATQLIFNRHHFQFNTIADIYQTIQDQLHQLPQLVLNQIIRSINLSLQFAFEGSADGLYQFSVQLLSLICPASGSQLDRPTDFHPDSPIGLYVRACRLDILTLEFDHLSAVAAQLKAFFNPPSPSNSTPPSSNIQPHIDPALEAYLDFTDSYAPDYNKASNSLRRFYDIRSINNNHHSKSSNQSGSNHQQALLSLSKFYLSIQAYPTALDALEEAARLARLANDRSILDQCASLERRIIYFSGYEAEAKIEQNGTTIKEEEGGGLTGPVQAQARLQSLRNLGHSNEDEQKRNGAKAKLDGNSNNNEWSFWDFNEEIFLVFKSLFIGAEPINHLHARLFRANRMKIVNNNSQNDSGGERENHAASFDQISWFALQAKIWDLQGQVGLCEIYEDLALEFHDESSKDEHNFIHDSFKLISKSDVTCHRALRLAKNGQFYEALLLVCQLIIDNQSDGKSFRYLQQTVSEIFVFKAKNDGNENLLETLKMFPSSTSPLSSLKPVSVQKQIENLFEQVEKFMDQGNHHAALCPIVSAIVQSDKMNLKTWQSKAIILWANVILHLHPASTEDITQDQGHNSGGGGNRILEKLTSILDLPALESNSLSKIQLFWTLVRLKIHHLFVHFPSNLDYLEHLTFEILDLFSLIDILYQKVEDTKGRKKVIGYELIIIEEIKLGLKSTNKSTNNSLKEKFKPDASSSSSEDTFINQINQIEKKLKQNWVSFSQNHQQQSNKFEHEFISLNNKFNHHHLFDSLVDSSSVLFHLVTNLFSLSSVHRYI